MKYRLLNKIIYGGKTLWEIEAIRDFGTVKKGDRGGWVEGEENLSQEGFCWIWKGAKVLGSARVWGDAHIAGASIIEDNARVGGNAKVFGSAKIGGNADIWGDSQISGNSIVRGDAKVWGNARIGGDALVCGTAEIGGFADIFRGEYSSGIYYGIGREFMDPAFRGI